MILGKYNWRHLDTPIHVPHPETHLYALGASGTGKTTLLESLILQLIHEGQGVALLDPHGDLAEKILHHIPPERARDTVYFNPVENTIGLNILELRPGLEYVIPEEVVSIFKSIWFDSWGNRLETILRASVYTLAGHGTLGDIPRLLTDTKYRERHVERVTDPVVRDFWVQQFNRWDRRLLEEAITPVLNRVRSFLFNEHIRNIVSDPRPRLDFERLMDGQILIANLAKGNLGEEITKLMTALITGKVFFTALSRRQRTPFTLFIDEVQNLPGNVLTKILSEARKFNLRLVIANQYLTQIPKEIFDAIIGNVGMTVCFRVGAQDAAVLAPIFRGFSERDLIHMEQYGIAVRLGMKGITAQAFSGITTKHTFAFRQHRAEKIKRSTVERFGSRYHR